MSRTPVALTVSALVLGLALSGCAPSTSLVPVGPSAQSSPGTAAGARDLDDSAGEVGHESPAAEGPAGESLEAATAAAQFLQPRLAPSGLVAPGAYGAAARAWSALPATGAAWEHVTALPYESDDERFRGDGSNSGAGSATVSGRVPAIAADGPVVYAGGAAGGVWRSSIGGGAWTSISDRLPALSTGDLQLNYRRGAGNGWLWYSTGDSATGPGSQLGSGVYALVSPRRSIFAPSDRVGGVELESTVINAIRFSADGARVFAATSRGLWSHSATTRSGGWTLLFAQTPSFLPAFPTASPARAAGAAYRDPAATFRNWVSDVAFDPLDKNHLVLAAGWRGGPPVRVDPDGGMYESRDGGSTWARSSLGGVFAPEDVGNTSFARGSSGGPLYAVVQSPRLLSTGASSYLLGVFASASGNPAGPWAVIATTATLARAGGSVASPGRQSWYNQFLGVDPADSQHLFLGLEEVFETVDGGLTWSVPGPYWNFYFPCFDRAVPNTSSTVAGCPITSHADQHAIAFGSRDGRPTIFVGNDGGVYARPTQGQVDAAGHATDWTPLNDGTIDTLQYYAVGVGAVKPSNRGAQLLGWQSGVIASGGLQDNGGSILRVGDPSMASNFGGDGGDVIVDPNDGCRLAHEYVYLAIMRADRCATSLDITAPASVDIRPTGETAARFIAPFAADPANVDSWIAGGRQVWTQDRGFAIASGDDWTSQFNLGADPATGADHVSTAVAISGLRAYAAWCGPCDPVGFSRGLATGLVGRPNSWKQLNLRTLPTRYISAIAIDPRKSSRAVVVVSGFSRAWNEGPGAGLGHVFLTSDAGGRWTDITGNLPDVPVNSVALLGTSIVVGSDFGVAVSSDRGARWRRLGSGLPMTVVTDLAPGPDGQLYAGTFGRGMWRVPLLR